MPSGWWALHVHALLLGLSATKIDLGLKVPCVALIIHFECAPRIPPAEKSFWTLFSAVCRLHWDGAKPWTHDIIIHHSFSPTSSLSFSAVSLSWTIHHSGFIIITSFRLSSAFFTLSSNVLFCGADQPKSSIQRQKIEFCAGLLWTLLPRRQFLWTTFRQKIPMIIWRWTVSHIPGSNPVAKAQTKQQT